MHLSDDVCLHSTAISTGLILSENTSEECPNDQDCTQKIFQELKEHSSRTMASSANPGPAGLVCFGFSTLLLSCHNAGFFPALTPGIASMGLFVGGLTQMLVGVLEFVNGNTYAMTAFMSYGFFWMSLIASTMFPKGGWLEAADSVSMGTFMLVWFIFTCVMFVGALKQNKALCVVIGSLALTFFVLMIEKFAESEVAGKIAGYLGIFCALSAIYLGYAELLNVAYKTDYFPIGAFKSSTHTA